MIMFKDRQEEYMLMDSPKYSSWKELIKIAFEKKLWRARARALRQSRVRVDIGSHHDQKQQKQKT